MPIPAEKKDEWKLNLQKYYDAITALTGEPPADAASPAVQTPRGTEEHKGSEARSAELSKIQHGSADNHPPKINLNKNGAEPTKAAIIDVDDTLFDFETQQWNHHLIQQLKKDNRTNIVLATSACPNTLLATGMYENAQKQYMARHEVARYLTSQGFNVLGILVTHSAEIEAQLLLPFGHFYHNTLQKIEKAYAASSSNQQNTSDHSSAHKTFLLSNQFNNVKNKFNEYETKQLISKDCNKEKMFSYAQRFLNEQGITDIVAFDDSDSIIRQHLDKEPLYKTTQVVLPNPDRNASGKHLCFWDSREQLFVDSFRQAYENKQSHHRHGQFYGATDLKTPIVILKHAANFERNPRRGCFFPTPGSRTKGIILNMFTSKENKNKIRTILSNIAIAHNEPNIMKKQKRINSNVKEFMTLYSQEIEAAKLNNTELKNPASTTSAFGWDFPKPDLWR